jgi:hypothetical protein
MTLQELKQEAREVLRSELSLHKGNHIPAFRLGEMQDILVDKVVDAIEREVTFKEKAGETGESGAFARGYNRMRNKVANAFRNLRGV